MKVIIQLFSSSRYPVQNIIAEHEIRNISCAAQDPEDLSTFAYITKDLKSSHHYCHVFTAFDVVSSTCCFNPNITGIGWGGKTGMNLLSLGNPNITLCLSCFLPPNRDTRDSRTRHWWRPNLHAQKIAVFLGFSITRLNLHTDRSGQILNLMGTWVKCEYENRCKYFEHLTDTDTKCRWLCCVTYKHWWYTCELITWSLCNYGVTPSRYLCEAMHDMLHSDNFKTFTAELKK